MSATTTHHSLPGQEQLRVAIRREGDKLVAYVAPVGTMEGAIVVGSLAVMLAELPGVFDEFTAMLAVAMRAMIEAQGVKVVDMQVRQAPEHERAGRA